MCANSSGASVGAPSCTPLEPELVEPLEPLLEPELGNGIRFPTMTPLEDPMMPDELEAAEELEPPADELDPPPVELVPIESPVSPASVLDDVVACPPHEVAAT
jgi:hypothetical protein